MPMDHDLTHLSTKSMQWRGTQASRIWLYGECVPEALSRFGAKIAGGASGSARRQASEVRKS